MYNIKLTKNEDFIIGKWSGGTTTQLSIYPKESVYGDRNFLWRISSAKVEIQESDFTPLPSYDRILMILAGKLKLEHKNHHNVELGEFEQDSFSGSWDTKSYGKVTDYNLMMGKGCSGSIEYIKVLDDNQIIDFGEKSNDDKEGHKNFTQSFYCFNGSVKVKVLDKQYKMASGDFLQIDSAVKDDKLVCAIENLGESHADIIITSVNY